MVLPFTVSCTEKDEETFSNFVKMSVTYTDGEGNEKSGDIIIQLYPDHAPITVQNFQELVADGFYDGLTFHRVISDFMIQGGDPKGNGTGGHENSDGEEITIKGEFLANGVQNMIRHKRGVISMARNGYSYDSASSQFFIVHQTSERNSYSLDGQYAAFGCVISGMEHVDGIASTLTDENDKPLSTAKIVSVEFVDGEDYTEKK